MARPTPVFYVLHGDDEFSLRAEAQVMRARVHDPALGDLNITRMDGKVATPREVIGAASAVPFAADKRLVIVEGMLAWLARKGSGKAGKADLDYLIERLPQLPDTARLVFLELEILPEKHPVLRLAQEPDKRGYVKACIPPRNSQDRTGRGWDMGWIMRWISQRAEFYGGRMEPRAAAALAQMVGQDLYAADSECAKLVSYVGPEQVITESDVATMTHYVPETNIFQIADALATRNSDQAAQIVHRLLRADDPPEPLALLGTISRHFRLLIQVREALDGGANVRELPEIKGDWHARRLSDQARHLSLGELEAIYRNLLETDYAIKSGRVGDALALDLLVAGLAE